MAGGVFHSVNICIIQMNVLADYVASRQPIEGLLT